MNRRRRIFDLAVGLPLLVVSSPLQIAVALAVKLSSRGPVLYRGLRVGLHGGEFYLRKFRSMRAQSTQDSNQAHVTVAGDSRITSVGRWIRLLKLDELPQLWDVVSGRMALVGPRPEHPEYVRSYTDQQREILDYRPGVTSPASILMRREEAILASIGGDPDVTYREIVLPAKIREDLNYFRTARLSDDVRVLWRTVKSILRPEPLESALATLALSAHPAELT